MKQIIVTVGKDATVKVETKGFSGPSCLQETQALEAAIGGVSRTEQTPEFYEPAGENEKAST